ncbi:response regulator transcription factor [Ruminococcaceae bacterium OttesenSCG-928-A16]|nr:response regulator transcription factor [Ruminococcaceae bacterium OttesenSCG-928-A16]
MAKILMVDDEEKIRALVKKYAVFDGYEVAEAENGMAAIQCCKQQEFDLIIMDVMMPELDGFSTVKEIRKFSRVPVIMLSARGEEYDRIHGFETGVDDYVVKPFSPKELMMRVAAVLSRAGTQQQPDGPPHQVYEKDGLMIDFTARKVSINGQPVALTPKEYDLLFYLVRNKGIALSREMLLTEVWGYDFYGDDRTLDTHIKMLRKALGNYSAHIVTLRGTGYRFDG